MTTAGVIARLLAASVLVASVGCKSDPAPARTSSVASNDGAGAGGGWLRPSLRQRPGLPAGAAPLGGRDHGRRWTQADQLSPDELQARRAEMEARRDERRQEMLDTYDADHDGTLSDTERAAMHMARVTELVDRLDTDGDGKLSKTELDDGGGRGRRPPPDFATLDTDHDGVLTVDELAKAPPPRGGPWRGRDRVGADGDGADGAAPGPATK